MSYKVATYISIGLILILNVLYLMSANVMSARYQGRGLGPGVFPIILSALLFFFCVVSAIQTYIKKEDKQLEMPHIKKVIFLIVLIALFFLVWSITEFFHGPAFVLMFILFSMHKPKEWYKKRVLLTNFAKAGVVILVIYLLFNVIMSFKL